MMWMTNSITVGRVRRWSETAPDMVELEGGRERSSSHGRVPPRTPIDERDEMPDLRFAAPPPRRPRTSTLPSQMTYQVRHPTASVYTTHKDFTPKLVNGHVSESFYDLVERANKWLGDHPELELFTCETVTWSAQENVPFFTDSTVITTASGGKKTKFTQGLRLWCNKITSQGHGKKETNLSFRDYTTKEDSIVHILQHINDDLLHHPFHGEVLNVETIHKLENVLETCWNESLNANRRYVAIVRVFFQSYKGCQTLHGELVLRDFCPKYDERSPHNEGWQPFQDLFSLAAAWINKNSHVNFRLINLQSLVVKAKKDINNEKVHTIKLWEPVLYKEYGAGKVTDYLQIMRVAYMRPRPASTHPIGPFPVPSLSYRTFLPDALSQVNELTEVVDKNFEEMRTLVAKTKSWITDAGVQPVHVQTLLLPYKQTVQGMAAQSSEATFSVNYVVKNVPQPKVMAIRVYFTSDNSVPRKERTSRRRDTETQTAMDGAEDHTYSKVADSIADTHL